MFSFFSTEQEISCQMFIFSKRFLTIYLGELKVTAPFLKNYCPWRELQRALYGYNKETLTLFLPDFLFLSIEGMEMTYLIDLQNVPFLLWCFWACHLARYVPAEAVFYVVRVLCTGTQ
jgi:hypothetical protein